jgi:capsular exopolysaccharide synthesis family protein
MEKHKNTNDNFSFEDESSSFDLKKWLRLLFHYWYLFAIAVVIALIFAYLSNRSWMPSYKVSARIMINDNSRGMTRNQGQMAVMQGFASQEMFRGTDNQRIMLRSTELSKKAVERMGLDIDVFRRTRFKTRNLYKNNPVEIRYDSLSNSVYAKEFHFEPINDTTFQISIVEPRKPFLGFIKLPFLKNQYSSEFLLKGKYGETIKNEFFTIKIKQKEGIKPFDFNFNFKTIDGWEALFNPRLSLSMIENSSVLVVSLTGNVLERDKDFLDALFAEFLSEDLRKKNETATKTINFIDGQLLILADSLDKAEDNLRQFRVQNKMFDASQYGTNLITKVNALDQEKKQLELKTTYLDYLSNYLKNNIEDGNIIAPSTFGVEHAALTALLKEYSDLQVRKGEIGEKNPYFQKYQTQLENKKLALFEVLNNMYADIEIESSALDLRYSELMGDLNALPDKESQMLAYQRAYKIHDNYYTYLTQKRYEAQIQQASNSPDNVILERARFERVTNAGEKRKRYTIDFAIGLLIPLAFLVLRELLNPTVRDKDDVKKYTKYSIIGAIQKGKYDSSPLLVCKHPKSIFAEGFRLIKTRLEFVTADHKKNKSVCLLVTSTESGDGKSFFCVNLAGIYSMEKKKTLLIDLDLRKPSIGKLLSIDQKKGLSNYLIGQAELDDVLIKSEEYSFDIITAGTIPPNPGELVKTKKLKELLHKLKEQYDYIIIDSSPIGLVGDAYALTNHVDANIFIVRQNKTNKTFFKNIIEQLREDNIHNLYIVMNGADVKKHQYGTYYGGYGGGYGYGYMRKLYTSDKDKSYYDYYEN